MTLSNILLVSLIPGLLVAVIVATLICGYIADERDRKRGQR